MTGQTLVAETTVLRQWMEGDLNVLQTMRNDVKLQHQLMARAQGSTIEQVRVWVTKKSEAADTCFWVIASLPSSEVVGYLQIAGIDMINGLGRLGICISPPFHRMGHGLRAIKLAEKYASDVVQLRKLSLEVLAENKPAIATYKKLAYAEAGRLRRHFLRWQGDAYDDVLIMEKFL